MEEKTVRAQLEEVQRALSRTEEEREVLISLVRGYEGWLRIHGVREGPSQPLPLRKSAGGRGRKPKGRISLRSAVREVLREAQGEPLHSRELARRVLERGAVSESKKPANVVALVALGLKRAGEPVDKVAPNTWAWVADDKQGGEAE